MAVVISDLFGEVAKIVSGLDHLRFLNHEVIIFHVMDPVERDLALEGNIRFRDMESGETLTTQAERNPGCLSRGGPTNGEKRSRSNAASGRSTASSWSRPTRSTAPCSTTW